MRRSAPFFRIVPLLLLAAAAVFGQENARIVAVSDFENYSTDARFSSMPKGIADAIINGLVTLDGLMVVERQKLDQVMTELQLGQSGLMNDMTVQKVGRSLAAGLMVVGGFEANSLTRQIRVNARIVQIETGLIVYSDTVIDDENLVDDLERSIADKLSAWFRVRYGLKPAAGLTATSEEIPAVAEESRFTLPDDGMMYDEETLETNRVPATNGTVESSATGDEQPRPASMLERIRLMFTDMRVFKPAVKDENAPNLSSRIRAATLQGESR